MLTLIWLIRLSPSREVLRAALVYLALALLVTRVTANHHHTSVTTDDSALSQIFFTLGFTFIVFPYL
jgi:hypothetical protein